MSSRTFRLLASGSSTCLMPARCAARTLSRMPPTGSTCPRSVTSPVTAVSLRMGRPMSSEATARSTATPAEGPSFGMPPAGKCTWTSSPRKGSRETGAASGPLDSAGTPEDCSVVSTSLLNAGAAAWAPTPARTKRLRSSESAVFTLSLMTSPSRPVTVRRPLPRVRAASMKRRLPPTEDTERPMATPTVSLSAMSGSDMAAPTMYGRCSAPTVMWPCASGPHDARAASFSWSFITPTPWSRRAAQRHTCATRRSRSRTPLSEVHFWTRADTASGGRTSRGSSREPCDGADSEASSRRGASGSSACRRRCFGIRCVVAMETFSSAVYPDSSTTSILSSSGRSISEVSFAVQMKSTFERSKGVFR
mmetsp:Transcript_60752/g.178205  ORF Transcript_60752/g.178205 Transcript_60752/m.178205 type:complete len:364 (-) Transcript_60752:1541-2632(-)